MDFRFLSESVGKKVQIERGGPNKIVGILRGTQQDFVTIENEKGEVTYLQSQHIKTLSETVLSELPMSQDTTTGNTNVQEQMQIVPKQPISTASDFETLLAELAGLSTGQLEGLQVNQATGQPKLVRINQGGEAVEGVIIGVIRDSTTGPVTAIKLLHAMKEFIHLPVFHIKSITAIYNKQEDKKQENQKNEQGKANEEQNKTGKK